MKKLDKISLDSENRMLRFGFGKHKGSWFIRIDLWCTAFRLTWNYKMTKEEVMAYGWDRNLNYEELTISHKNLLQAKDTLPEDTEYMDYWLAMWNKNGGK